MSTEITYGPGAVGAAEHDVNRVRTGKVHATASGSTPVARRNRSRYRTRCGRVIARGLPVRVVDVHSIDVCRHCFPRTFGP